MGMGMGKGIGLGLGLGLGLGWAWGKGAMAPPQCSGSRIQRAYSSGGLVSTLRARVRGEVGRIGSRGVASRAPLGLGSG